MTATRLATLDTAKDLIVGERDASYGDASKSFARIAAVWSALLDIELTAAQVALCLAGLKLSRLAVSPNHGDSWVDLAGYAGLGSEVAERESLDEFSAANLAALREKLGAPAL